MRLEDFRDIVYTLNEEEPVLYLVLDGGGTPARPVGYNRDGEGIYSDTLLLEIDSIDGPLAVYKKYHPSQIRYKGNRMNILINKEVNDRLYNLAIENLHGSEDTPEGCWDYDRDTGDYSFNYQRYQDTLYDD